MINVLYKLINALKTIAINLNVLNFKITLHTLKKREAYANV